MTINAHLFLELDGFGICKYNQFNKKVLMQFPSIAIIWLGMIVNGVVQKNS